MFLSQHCQRGVLIAEVAQYALVRGQSRKGLQQRSLLIKLNCLVLTFGIEVVIGVQLLSHVLDDFSLDPHFERLLSWFVPI